MNKIEYRQFTCGHSDAIPRNMGRGEARVKRLNAYFGRLCLHCRLSAEDQFEARLTSPRTVERSEQARKTIRKSY